MWVCDWCKRREQENCQRAKEEGALELRNDSRTIGPRWATWATLGHLGHFGPPKQSLQVSIAILILWLNILLHRQKIANNIELVMGEDPETQSYLTGINLNPASVSLVFSKGKVRREKPTQHSLIQTWIVELKSLIFSGETNCPTFEFRRMHQNWQVVAEIYLI